VIDDDIRKSAEQQLTQAAEQDFVSDPIPSAAASDAFFS
jgi:hypothetical protein